MNIETRIKLDKFKPRSYQRPIMDAIENKGYKRVLAIMPRRAGKDVTAFNLAIRACVRRPCVIYYIFPTYAQAKKVIWDSLTNEGERILDYIPDELVVSKNSQEMKVRFKNGSLLQLVGSDNFNSLMGTNPTGVIFSEYALQDPRAYQYIRPILTANDGWALFISCVAPQTLVIGAQGLQRIKDVSSSREEYSDLNKSIWGKKGFHNAESFYFGGRVKTIKIELANGSGIECSSVHPIWDGNNWVKAKDIKIGHRLPIQYGADVWGEGLDRSSFTENIKYSHTWDSTKQEFNANFFYLLGLIHADGNYNRNNVTVTKKKDQEIIDFLHAFGFRTRPDGIHHEFSSRQLCLFLEWLGFKHGARNKTFPDKLFTCSKEQMVAFLQGLFDGDGTSNSCVKKRGKIKLTSTCLSFLKDLQVVLLNFGIVSSIYHEFKEATKCVPVSSHIYNLEITGHFAHVFYRDIGFRLKRKQKNSENIPLSCRAESGNIYPIDPERSGALPKNIITNPKAITRRLISVLAKDSTNPYWDELLAEKLFYSPVTKINYSENDVFDFVIPDTHSFFSNGFLSHNTPRGKNHLWTLYQIAMQSPEWYCLKLTVEDTKHISLTAIAREKADGIMSDDLIQQEYYTSFQMGVEGAYYAKYLDKLRVSGQIGDVPWENGFKVHTAWDLGMRDATSIIFYQAIGQTIRVIDCYENSKEGLEHYVRLLESKPYSYGRHFLPHDIKVRELGTGITRLAKLRQLGISGTVVADVSIPDGIEAVRTALGKMWFDATRCAPLIKALENYRQEYDIKKKVYKNYPLHDWSSHFSDSMRYLCISLSKTGDGLSGEQIEKNYREAMYGDRDNLPGFFSDKKHY